MSSAHDGAIDPGLARRAWHALECVNAVTYFSPECTAGTTALGLQGFWMGYFANRAAPLGPAGPGVVEATFYNFHPDRVRRAIPDAWSRVDPAVVLDARSAAAAAALRRLLPDGGAERVADAVGRWTEEVIAAASPAGLPLFAANRDVERPDDPVAALWQRATTLREHRGDGHVALLAGAGLDGCEVHVLAAAVTGGGAELYQASRGWSPDDWASATERLAGRGLVDSDGTPLDAGRALHAGIEARTDELAARPYAVVGGPALTDALAVLEPAARTIAAGGDIRFPNPMGLPAPD